MKKAPEREGKIIADLHSHASEENDLNDIVTSLSWGITGLSVTNNGLGILSYEGALNLPHTREIDEGLFAELSLNGEKGYFVKTQEVKSDHHILAVGCKEYLDDYGDARKTVDEIHKQGGLAILNHPCIVSTGKNFPVRYRSIRENEEKRVRELYGLVDEVEVFNAQCINPTFGIFVPNMKKVNKRAKELASEYGFKGTAASDAQFLLEQVKICGIYIPRDNLSIESLKDHIKNKNFERFEQYISRLSFLKGHLLSNQVN